MLVDGSPSLQNVGAAATDRGEHPQPGPDRLDDGVRDVASDGVVPNAWGRNGRASSWGSAAIIDGHRSGDSAARIIRPWPVPPRPPVRAPAPGGLAGLTPSGRAIVPAAWSLYDFANTIFSFAVVSGAIGLYLNDQFGQRDGAVLLARRRSR